MKKQFISYLKFETASKKKKKSHFGLVEYQSNFDFSIKVQVPESVIKNSSNLVVLAIGIITFFHSWRKNNLQQLSYCKNYCECMFFIPLRIMFFWGAEDRFCFLFSNPPSLFSHSWKTFDMISKLEICKSRIYF